MRETTDLPVFVLVIRVSPGPSNLLDTQGWRIVKASHEAVDLIGPLRRKAPYLRAIDGEGMVVRAGGDGGTVRTLMHSALTAKAAPTLTRLPRLLETPKRETWERQVEAYVAAVEAAEAEAERARARGLADDGRRVIVSMPKLPSLASLCAVLPPRRVAAGLGAALALVTGVYCVPWGALGDGRGQMAARVEAARRANGADSGGDARELAEGGTIRRLQAVSQAFGKQY